MNRTVPNLVGKMAIMGQSKSLNKVFFLISHMLLPFEIRPPKFTFPSPAL